MLENRNTPFKTKSAVHFSITTKAGKSCRLLLFSRLLFFALLLESSNHCLKKKLKTLAFLLETSYFCITSSLNNHSTMTDKQLHYIEGVGWRYDCDHSMTHRMKCHDYKTRSIYMLTITLADRSHPLLGTLRWKQKEETNVGKADETTANKAKEADASNVGETKATAKEDTSLPSPLDREAVVDLTPLGKRVRDCWEQIPVHYPDVRTIILQIMPEHLHGVLFVTQDQEAHLGQMVKGFKIGCSKTWWALNPSLLFDAPQNAAMAASSSATAASSATSVPSSALLASSPAPSVSSAPSCSPNYNSARTTDNTPHPLPRSKGAKGPSLFASGYNDSVLIGEGQLANMIRYVQQNPLRAMIKREHPNLFRIARELRFGGHIFAAIGNHWLLERPMRMPVRCHNNTSEANLKLIAKQKEYFLHRGDKGGVVVSPCISPGEKEIARAALDAQHPLIVILENGFPPLYKPPGKYFEACAKGLLLMLAPWPHHTERRSITREQCLALNNFAFEICDEPWTCDMEQQLLQLALHKDK